MSNHPIAEYALLSDCHGAALVHRSGSVDWLCLPRFDSPALFTRLLDADGGHWQIAPLAPHTCERRYSERTLVLETRFCGAGGEVLLRDTLAVGRDETGHEIGMNSPHILLREIRCTRGELQIGLDFVPRPEYGLVVPVLREVDDGVLARGGASVLRLSSTVRLRVEGDRAVARFLLKNGERAAFALQHWHSDQAAPPPWPAEGIHRRLWETEQAWRSWSDLHQGYQGPWSELVQHSGRVLQALTYQPTGAFVAAPTTSLPEAIGGPRNWDYRYSWVRDASFTLDALWVAACPDEAHKFFEFLANAAFAKVRAGQNMQTLFGIGGEHDLTERPLHHLRGWRNSRPIRIGNAAWEQRQNDIYGELLAAAERLVNRLAGRLDAVGKAFLIEIADRAAANWQQPDHGIWEVRGEPRHFLYSKLMCWVGLDRAIRLAGVLDGRRHVERWKRERERIRSAILRDGWSEKSGAFAMAFGHDALDAAVLTMPLVGFLPADDPRMRSTVAAIEARLTDRHGLVRRYDWDDQQEGREGAFLLCTFWLAQVQAEAGRVEDARATFERAASYANDVGLLAEQVDPTTGELLGNFPQAFSHIGLVNAAWAIGQAERCSR